jgi:hypothetical protein
MASARRPGGQGGFERSRVYLRCCGFSKARLKNGNVPSGEFCRQNTLQLAAGRAKRCFSWIAL